MALHLVEATFKNTVIDTKEAFEQKVSALKDAVQEDNINLIEVQVAKDFSRSFFIFESEDEAVLTSSLENKDLSVELVKAVRIVGKDLEEVKKQSEEVNYLVEWNIPENITMDQYLDRKKKNSVHYAEVPEVSFSRTYVCEDMSKCLCFYDAPDEDAVKRAREAVNTPIDSITEIASDK
ncbi:ssDNA-specific exonuclease RecJ [Virgibacillus halotolerans]|uniref:DUF4242 domain-containing protein n=1 Tax=Virgibacillus halotolerans TaxID=1071053 RepID=UPI001961DE39|nr:DUF4242 domain-containing protein [Virgibacillus halotolerans]MBM7599536.1 ssDNA-specific exonuclease RecJ [Virgibacillus halotolerans]